MSDRSVQSTGSGPWPPESFRNEYPRLWDYDETSPETDSPCSAALLVTWQRLVRNSDPMATVISAVLISDSCLSVIWTKAVGWATSSSTVRTVQPACAKACCDTVSSAYTKAICQSSQASSACPIMFPCGPQSSKGIHAGSGKRTPCAASWRNASRSSASTRAAYADHAAPPRHQGWPIAQKRGQIPGPDRRYPAHPEPSPQGILAGIAADCRDAGNHSTLS